MRGPYVRQSYMTSNVINYGQTSYRQDRGAPYRKPLPYSHSEYSVRSRWKDNRWSKYTTLNPLTPSYSYNQTGWPSLNRAAVISEQRGINACYAQFQSKYREECMVAVDLMEWRQTFDMLVGLTRLMKQPIKQISTSLNKVATKALNQRAKGSSRSKAKAKRFGKQVTSLGDSAIGSSADAWLKFHFGLMPLMQDFFSAMLILTNPIPERLVVAKVRMPAEYSVNGFKSYDGLYYHTDEHIEQKVKMSAIVRVTNPNLFLADQLGLLNPSAIAWELVPWSFLIDWFVNVGQMLGTLSSWAGVEMRDAYTTTYTHGAGTTKYWFSPGTTPPVGRLYCGLTYQWFSMKRVLGITTPKFEVVFPKFSPVRVATSLSLAYQPLGNLLRKNLRGT